MKTTGLKLLLFLLASVALGVGSGSHYFSDGFDYANYACDNNPEFEDDICFDLLVHHMHLDVVVDDYHFNFAQISYRVSWYGDESISTPSNEAIALPLRAPPSIG